jgi:hypothetical protein
LLCHAPRDGRVKVLVFKRGPGLLVGTFGRDLVKDPNRRAKLIAERGTLN